MIRVLIFFLSFGCLLPAVDRQFDLVVEDKPLLIALERLADEADVSLVVSAELSERVARSTTIVARDATWAQVNDVIIKQHGLALVRTPGWLTVEDVHEAYNQSLVWRLYDVRALVVAAESHYADELGIPEPGGKAAVLLPPIEAGQVLDLAESLAAGLPADQAPTGNAYIRQEQGFLSVLLPPTAQELIAQQVAELIAARSRQIHLRCWRLPAGITAVSADAAAWAALSAQATPMGSLLAHSDQTMAMTAVQERRVILDTEVVQHVHQPVVVTIATGCSFDATARRVDGGLLATIRIFSADPVEGFSQDIHDATGSAYIRIDEPRCARNIIHSTRLIPDGGAALWPGSDATWAITWE